MVTLWYREKENVPQIFELGVCFNPNRFSFDSFLWLVVQGELKFF